MKLTEACELNVGDLIDVPGAGIMAVTNTWHDLYEENSMCSIRVARTAKECTGLADWDIVTEFEIMRYFREMVPVLRFSTGKEG